MTSSLPSRPGSNRLCGVTRKRRDLTTLCATGTVLVTECVRHFHFCRLVSHATRASSPVSARPLARIAVQLTCRGRRTWHVHSSSTPRRSLASRNSFNTPFMRRLDWGREVRTITDNSKFKNFVKSLSNFTKFKSRLSNLYEIRKGMVEKIFVRWKPYLKLVVVKQVKATKSRQKC